MPTDISDNEVFAFNLAALAREIAMDIFPLAKILEIHRLSDDEWQRISTHPKFTQKSPRNVTVRLCPWVGV